MNLDEVTVVGSGAGGMAVACDLVEHGAAVTLADLVEFSEGLEAIREQGGIARRPHDQSATDMIPVDNVTTDLQGAALAPTVVVVAPLLGHARLLAAMGNKFQDVQRLLFIGEGSGVLRIRAKFGARPPSAAEFNTLPYLARVEAPGRIMVRPKRGGVLVAASPTSHTASWEQLAVGIWPCVTAAHDVFDTAIANYNVIDHVPTVLANAGYLEAGSGSWRLWGEGCTPAVARAIHRLDEEMQRLRITLGLPERRYAKALAAQGFAPEEKPTVYEAISSSVLSTLEVQRDPHFLRSRFIMEDVPHALVLLESIAEIYGVSLPLSSSLITFASVLTGDDLRASGTTIESLGLPLQPAELERLLREAAA